MTDLSGGGSVLSPAKPPTPPPSDTSAAGAASSIQSLTQQTKDRSQALQGAADKTAGELDTIKKQRDALVPPTLEKLPEAPGDTKYRDPIQAMGSVAGLLAVFGGALTRHPLRASLDAAAGVLNAYRSQDDAAANQKFKEWKVNTENALKLQDFKMKAYEEALSKSDSDEKTALAKFNALAVSFGDQTAAEAAQIHGITAVQQVLNEQRRLTNEIETNIPKVAEAKAMHDLVSSPDFKKKSPEERLRAIRDITSPDTFDQIKAQSVKALSAKLQQSGMSKEEADVSALKSVTDATKPQTTGTPAAQALKKFMEEHPDATADDIQNFVQKGRPSRSAPAMALQKYMQENPQATADDITNFSAGYGARVKAVAAFSTGKQGDIVRSFDVATQHLDTLDKLADALNNGDTKAFNAVANQWAKQTGQPAPTNFETAKTIIGNEIVKSIVGAAGTGEDRDRAQAAFNSAYGPKVLHEATQTIRSLMGGQLVGIEKQYVDTTGKSESDFEERLTPGAKKVLKMALSGETGTTGTTGTGASDIQSKAKTAWGSYEPEKYDYRVNDDGVLQRKAKE